MTNYNKIKSFLKNSGGNFAITFGLTMLPIMLSVGVATDYTSAVGMRSKLQEAIDAAALAAGTDENISVNQRVKRAKDAFDALTVDLDLNKKPNFKIDEHIINASISIDKPNNFSGIIGKPTIGITVGVEIQYAVEKAAEVAMVLDYSGSMGWNKKWSTMRDAAKDLVDVLGEDGERDDIKFALAPFSNQMHVSLPSAHVVGQNAGKTWTGCTQDRKWPFNTEDSTPVYGNDATKWGLTPSASEKDCKSHIKRGLTVRPLTNDHEKVKEWLDGMVPGGNTHISLGLAFGWHLVSPNAPFEEGVEYDEEGTKKFIVLLTDGAQTTKAWAPNDKYRVKNGEINLEALCKDIKKKNVHMITIAFDLKDEPTRNRLRNCATNKGYFFEADSNSELTTAFETIGALIQGSLHISR